MENPRYHAKWQAAVDSARATPELRERVEAIIAEKTAMGMTWSSKIKLIYYACVEAGLIKDDASSL